MRTAICGILLSFLILTIFSIISQEVEARKCLLPAGNWVSGRNLRKLTKTINSELSPEDRLKSIVCATKYNSSMYNVHAVARVPGNAAGDRLLHYNASPDRYWVVGFYDWFA